jgi:hypothetical protein
VYKRQLVDGISYPQSIFDAGMDEAALDSASRVAESLIRGEDDQRERLDMEQAERIRKLLGPLVRDPVVAAVDGVVAVDPQGAWGIEK